MIKFVLKTVRSAFIWPMLKQLMYMAGKKQLYGVMYTSIECIKN